LPKKQKDTIAAHPFTPIWRKVLAELKSQGYDVEYIPGLLDEAYLTGLIRQEARQGRGEIVDDFVVWPFKAATFIFDEVIKQWAWFPKMGRGPALEAARRNREEYLDNCEGRHPVETYYVSLRVFSDGTVEMDCAEQADTGALALDFLIQASWKESLSGPGAPLDAASTYTPDRPMSEQQAKDMARALLDRLHTDLGPLFKSKHGGSRTYRKRIGGRLQHGLTNEQLKAFARRADELQKTGGPTVSRSRAAKEFGVPAGYGGEARPQALWRLYKRGKALLEDNR
jgi:hypothetical protein